MSFCPQNSLIFAFLHLGSSYWLGTVKLRMSSWTHPLGWYTILKISYLVDFSSKWLTNQPNKQMSNWLAYLLTYLLMPSDKRNSIMAEATGLNPLITVHIHFVPRRAFLPTIAAPMLTSWFTFLLICDPFLSPLQCRWQIFGTCIMDPWVSALSARVLLTLFFAWCITKSVQSCRKRSILIQCGWVTHPFWLVAKLGRARIKHNIFSIEALVDCGDDFYAVIRL